MRPSNYLRRICRQGNMQDSTKAGKDQLGRSPSQRQELGIFDSRPATLTAKGPTIPYPPSNSPLERLPQELLCQVASFLPLESVAVLCLSSKNLYRRLPHAYFELLYLTADDLLQHMLQYGNSGEVDPNTSSYELANLSRINAFSTVSRRARFLRALERDCLTLVYCDMCLRLHHPVAHEDSSDADNGGEISAAAKKLTDKCVCIFRLSFSNSALGEQVSELWESIPDHFREDLYLYEGYLTFRKGNLEVLPARFHFLQIKMLMKQYRLGLDFSKTKAFLEGSPLSVDLLGGWKYKERYYLHPTPKGLFLKSKHEYSLPWSTARTAIPCEPEATSPLHNPDSLLGYKQTCAHCTLRHPSDIQKGFYCLQKSFSKRRWFWWLRSKFDFVFRQVDSCSACPTETEVRLSWRREPMIGKARGEKFLVYSLARWMDLGMGELATDIAWKSHFVEGSFPAYECGSVKAMDTTFARG